jgi:hypothetical protein
MSTRREFLTVVGMLPVAGLAETTLSPVEISDAKTNKVSTSDTNKEQTLAALVPAAHGIAAKTDIVAHFGIDYIEQQKAIYNDPKH